VLPKARFWGIITAEEGQYCHGALPSITFTRLRPTDRAQTNHASVWGEFGEKRHHEKRANTSNFKCLSSPRW
jgi:hypothetical protein